MLELGRSLAELAVWSTKKSGCATGKVGITLMHSSHSLCRLRLHTAVHGILKLGPIHMVIFVYIEFTVLK